MRETTTTPNVPTAEGAQTEEIKPMEGFQLELPLLAANDAVSKTDDTHLAGSSSTFQPGDAR